jgi:hypothetical protein
VARSRPTMYVCACVMPNDLVHILQRACAAIRTSQHPAKQKTRQDQLAWRAAMMSSLVPGRPIMGLFAHCPGLDDNSKALCLA